MGWPSTTSADLDGVFAQDMATLDRELERARALLAVSINGYELKNVSEQWRADRGVVLAAVRQCGEALRFASSEIVQDRVVVLAAVLQNPWALRFAARRFQSAKHVVLAAVRQDPAVIEMADAALKLDPEIVLNALYIYGSSCTPVAPDGAGDVLDGDGPEAPYFLSSFDQQHLARLGIAVADWVQTCISNGDEEAAHRQHNYWQTGDPPHLWQSFSAVDYAGWAASKLDRRRALMVLYRSDPFRRRASLTAHVLKFL